MDSRIAPSFLHPSSAQMVRRSGLQAGLLTYPHLKPTFPPRLSEAVVFSARWYGVSLRHVPYICYKVRDYSGGTVPESHGIPFYTLMGTCTPLQLLRALFIRITIGCQAKCCLLK
jgi:hypothetical protein